MHFPNFSAYGEKIRMTKKYVCTFPPMVRK